MTSALETVVLGTSLPTDPEDRSRLREALVSLWTAQYGPLGPLDSDLQACATLFSAERKGSKVREILRGLPDAPDLDAVPTEPLVEPGLDSWQLVSPEGRLAIEWLDEPASGSAADDVTTLIRLYRCSSRHRLRQVVRDQSDTGKPAQAPSVGLLIVLLMCGNVGPDAALPRGERNDDDIDQSVARAVEAFASVVAPSNRRLRQAGPRRRGSWELGELTRRKDQLVVRDATSLFVIAGGETEAAEAAGALLARRPRLTKAKVVSALDALSVALEEEEETLTGRGVPVRDSASRDLIGDQVVAGFEAARGAADNDSGDT